MKKRFIFSFAIVFLKNAIKDKWLSLTLSILLKINPLSSNIILELHQKITMSNIFMFYLEVYC